MITCYPITNIAELYDLWPAWHRLWRLSGATPFQHPSFVCAWWRAFHPGTIESVAFFRAGELVALAPFYREAETLRLLIMGMGLGDYLDLVALPDDETRHTVLDHIRTLSPPLSLEDLPPSSILNAYAVERHRLCPVSDPTRAVPTRMRRGLALAANRIARRGGFVMRCSSPPIDEAALQRLAMIHRLRQGQLGRPSIFDDSAVQSFMREIMGDAHFPIELHEVAIEELPAAAAVTLHDAKGIYFWLQATHPAFTFESPAKLLLGKIWQNAQTTGAGHIFWLRGDEAYKQSWGAEPSWSYRLRREVQTGLQASA